MKNRLVRKAVFETNSSSAHSLTINDGRRSLHVYQTLKPNKKGVVVVDCGGYNFCRQKPRRTNDALEKLAFFATLSNYIGWFDDFKEEIVPLIIEKNNVKSVEFINVGESPIEFTSDFDIPSTPKQMYLAIFDKNSWLGLIGDEYWFETEKEEKEFFNPPLITK